MRDDHESDVRTILPTAERILTDKFGVKVSLELEDRIASSPRSNVIRFHIREGPTDAPSSVIVKQAIFGDDEQASNPDASDLTPLWRFSNEWAGLQFLGEAFDSDPPAPRMYGGDWDTRIIVMEDLTGCENLVAPLLGSNPLEAEAALIDFMSLLGQLHARTIGKAQEYHSIRNAFRPYPHSLRDFGCLPSLGSAWRDVWSHRNEAPLDLATRSRCHALLSSLSTMICN